MCITYGELVKDSEKIIYYETVTVRHLGNVFTTDNNCTSDINYKCSIFIGYFNKMMSLKVICNLMCYVSYLNHTVFVFYGSSMAI